MRTVKGDPGWPHKNICRAIEGIVFGILWLLLVGGTVVAFLTQSFWSTGACLVLLGYLVMLNDCLRGSLKAWIDVFLGINFVGLVILCFVSFGWKVGLGSIVTPMIAGAVLKPLARLHAGYILSH